MPSRSRTRFLPTTTLSTDQTGTMPTQRRRKARFGPCPCCARQLDLSFHHLIPRKVHRRRRFARLYSKQQLAMGVYICRDCHTAIHSVYSEMELANSFCSLDLLLGDEKLARSFSWLGRQRRQSTAPLPGKQPSAPS